MSRNSRLPSRNFRSLRQAANMHHGRKRQAQAIFFIAQRVEFIEDIMSVDGCLDITIPIDPVLRECKDKVTPEISVRTLARYWKIYEEWGLLPCDVSRELFFFVFDKKISWW